MKKASSQLRHCLLLRNWTRNTQYPEVTTILYIPKNYIYFELISSKKPVIFGHHPLELPKTTYLLFLGANNNGLDIVCIYQNGFVTQDADNKKNNSLPHGQYFFCWTEVTFYIIFTHKIHGFRNSKQFILQGTDEHSWNLSTGISFHLCLWLEQTMQKPQSLLSPHWCSLRGHHNLNSRATLGIPTSLQQEHLKISSWSTEGLRSCRSRSCQGQPQPRQCWGTPQSQILSSAHQSHPDHYGLSLNPTWHSTLKNVGEKGFPDMLWSYHWRALSPEKQGSRGGSDNQTEGGGQKWTQAPQGWLPDLSIWLWGGWKHTKQTRFPIREFWCRTQQCGVGACIWCSKAPHSMPGRACGRPNGLQRSSTHFTQERALVCQVLRLLSNFWFVFHPWWLTTIWWASLSSWANTGSAGRLPSPVASGQAVQADSAAGAANKFLSAPEQAQREDCNTYSPLGYTHSPNCWVTLKHKSQNV